MFCPLCHRSAQNDKERFCVNDGAKLVSGPRINHLRPRGSEEKGRVIDERYVIRGDLGRGGMATVYLAEDTKDGEPVAIKVLNRHFTLDEHARERFLREIDVAAMVDHPNVTHILDAGYLPEGAPYIVMEHLFGESLGELLHRDDTVEVAFALPLFRAAAAALATVHAASIIHRDVKPDNLFLLGERGDAYDIKVMDFGMAKLLKSPLTAAGTSLGTLAYMPPEQILTDPVDARADVYSLGVVMYRTFTGRLPFNHPDDRLIVAQHIFEEPPPPRRFMPEMDPRLELVLLKAIRKAPENRHSTMKELVADIDWVLGRGSRPSFKPVRPGGDVYRPKLSLAMRAAEVLRRKLDQRGPS